MAQDQTAPLPTRGCTDHDICSGVVVASRGAAPRSSRAIEMELIRQRADGLYLLGRYDRIDELVRDSFLDLKAVEEVLVALSGVVSQVKDPDAV
jgi:hypothetical protein